jgi:hypothetical protein
MKLTELGALLPDTGACKAPEALQILDAEFEEDDEDDTGTETDLLEALELLQACLDKMEGVIRLGQVKRVNWMHEKELFDLCLEVSAFLNQWEDE